MGAPFLAIAGAQAVGGLVQAGLAAGRARRARDRARQAESEMNRLIASRQEIIDPSAVIADRSSLIQNQFANLQVATQAAQFRAEEADIALASTLDTLRATGAGAGGATALAQAALRSKRGISATIEQQEARNVELRARGAQMAQTARIQEGARVDRARMLGQEFMFGAREAREQSYIDRQAGLFDIARAQEQAERQAAAQGLGMTLGAVGGAVAGGLAGEDSFMANLRSLGYTE